jgi:hypothetical protein
MRHACAAALAAAALLAGCGRPFLSAKVEVAEVRITEPGQQFPPPFAVPGNPCPPAPASCVAAVTNDVSFDLGEDLSFVEEDGVELDVRLTEMGFHFLGGSSTGLQLLRVHLLEPGGGTTLIASYQRPAGSPAPTDVVVATNSDVNLASYLSAGVVGFRVELVYDGSQGVPSGGGPLGVDVTAVFRVEATIDYTKV